MNSAEELERFSKNPLVKSVLRVMTYELLWSSEDVKWFEQETNKLMERCGGFVKDDRDWITQAIVRMKGDFLKQQLGWDFARKGDEGMFEAKAEKMFPALVPRRRDVPPPPPPRLVRRRDSRARSASPAGRGRQRGRSPSVSASPPPRRRRMNGN